MTGFFVDSKSLHIISMMEWSSWWLTSLHT